ncbi:UNVERIFIED_CONTAM: hypothetical protein FKN15_035294 [Acipenser sinensis]
MQGQRGEDAGPEKGENAGPEGKGGRARGERMQGQRRERMQGQRWKRRQGQRGTEAGPVEGEDAGPEKGENAGPEGRGCRVGSHHERIQPETQEDHTLRWYNWLLASLRVRPSLIRWSVTITVWAIAPSCDWEQINQSSR